MPKDLLSYMAQLHGALMVQAAQLAMAADAATERVAALEQQLDAVKQEFAAYRLRHTPIKASFGPIGDAPLEHEAV